MGICEITRKYKWENPNMNNFIWRTSPYLLLCGGGKIVSLTLMRRYLKFQTRIRTKFKNIPKENLLKCSSKVLKARNSILPLVNSNVVRNQWDKLTLISKSLKMWLDNFFKSNTRRTKYVGREREERVWEKRIKNPFMISRHLLIKMNPLGHPNLKHRIQSLTK